VLYEEKNSYWRREIAATSGNSKKLWRTFNSVLGDVNSETSGLSADEFEIFFQDKVDCVSSSTQSLYTSDARIPFFNIRIR